MQKLTLLVLFALALDGCGAPSWAVRAQSYAEAGQCDRSRREVESASDSIEARAMVMAAIYGQCDKDRENFIKWATLAARYGNEPAIEWLTKLGAPVPAADLRRANSEMTLGQALLLGAAEGIRQQNQTPQSRITNTNCFRTGDTVNCTSF